MADPWLNWSWLKIGPFTPTQEDRVAADRRMGELKSEERRQLAADIRDREGIMSLAGPSGVPGDYGPPLNNQSRQFQQDYGTDMVPPPAVGPSQSLPYDPNLRANDMSLSEALGAGSRQWQTARENQRIDNMQPSRAEIEATKDADMGPVPVPAGAAPPTDETTPMQPVMPDTGTPAQPVMTPQQQMIEDIKQQRAMIDAIYPQRQTDNPSQDEAQAYAEKERDRANALAQLAFFSGVTQGAGGSWEGVGRGLAGAGAAYSQGFERYQKALQARANRVSDMNDQRYEDEASRSSAAVKLYENQQDQQKGLLSEARQAGKERRDAIDDYFKKRLDLAKGNDFTPTDQGTVDQIMREWRISRDRGEIIDSTDVRDKPKS